MLQRAIEVGDKTSNFLLLCAWAHTAGLVCNIQIIMHGPQCFSICSNLWKGRFSHLQYMVEAICTFCYKFAVVISYCFQLCDQRIHQLAHRIVIIVTMNAI